MINDSDRRHGSGARPFRRQAVIGRVCAMAAVAFLGCGDNIVDPPPACAELGCVGLEATCKPSSCACAPTKEDAPIACVAYPACAELECRSLACDEGHLCTCELDAGAATCETP